MNKITVINIEDRETTDFIYIGRGSIFGNPYHVKQHGREEAINLYKKDLWASLQSLGFLGKAVMSLATSTEDLVLGCHCKPQACHGDVIKAAILWLRSPQI